MPSSHLLRAPCDKWVFTFPYDISGIVGGYGIRQCFHIVNGHRAIFFFLYGNFSDRPGKAGSVQRPRGMVR